MHLYMKHNNSFSMTVLEKTFTNFDDLLSQRFQDDIVTNEDSVRYLFFHCLNKYMKIEPNEIVLEYPYENIKGAKLDTFIPPKKGRGGYAFEFKFDRKNVNSRNSPRSMQAGKVFADIFRLNMFNVKNIRKYLIYVTDSEMKKYFNNKNNGLYDFYNLEVGNKFEINMEYISDKSNTFIKNAGNYAAPVLVKKRYESMDEDDYWIKIFEILEL